MTTAAARPLANLPEARRPGRLPSGALRRVPAGEDVALPTEDLAEVDRRLAAFRSDLKPSTELGRCLVRRVAILSVRLDRSVLHETAALSERVRRAEAEFVPPEGLDADEAERLRAEAGRRALFDPSKEATLARRAEAAAEGFALKLCILGVVLGQGRGF